MANTQGFDLVAELTPAALLSIMQAAWEVTDVFPKNIPLDPGPLDGFMIQGGQVQVPNSGLGIQLVPPDSLQLQFELQIQIQLQNPPVPSAQNLDIEANASATVPIGVLPGKNAVGLLFGGLTPDKVGVTLVGGDPIGPKLHDYITEFVHQQFQNNGPSFPHQVTKYKQTIFSFTYDATLDLMDDPSDAAHQIKVSFPVQSGQEKLQISIPIHLKLYNIQPPGLAKDPMGVEAQLVLTTDLVEAPGSVSADLSKAQVTVTNLVPAGPNYGDEGKNYMPWAGFLTSLLTNNLQQQGQAMVQQMKPVSFTYPEPSKMQDFIAQQILKRLNAMGPFEVWPGTAKSPIGVQNVATVVLSDALVIALNSQQGSNVNAIVNFIPGGRTFAIAISARNTLVIINKAIKDKFPSLPTVIHNVDGHDVRLKSLSPSLTSAIHFFGDVTVIDAVLGSIDVDASFDVDVGLEWLPPNAQGQGLKANTGDPDVHLSGLDWLLGILTGFLTFGLIGVIIAVVVIEVVQHIASSLGSALLKDPVNNAVTGIGGAWPSPLQSVGDVKSAFENPIVISPDGLLFGG